jgi:tRNA1(Val) A37 N6-methylase TrmN6
MKDEFAFQHFTIRQDHCAMKVGTDGVLLRGMECYDRFECRASVYFSDS